MRTEHDIQVKVKILVADDHPLVLEGVRHVLMRLDSTVEVIEARDYTETLQYVSACKDLNLVLLDLFMPGMEQFEGLRRLREILPGTPIVVLSASEDCRHVQSALELGARGYIPKSATNQVMFAALEFVLTGGVYVPELSGFGIPPKTGSFTPSMRGRLTRRQHEIMTLVVEGKTNKTIARELGLSVETVRTHLASIFKILKVNNRTEAVHVMSESELIDRSNKS